VSDPAGDEQPLLDRFTELLVAQGLEVAAHDDAHAVRIDHHGADASWGCIIQAWEDDRVLLCYSVSPLRPTPETMAETAELLHRVNVGLLVGNFEIDLDDGEIRCKTSVGLGPTQAWSDDLALVILHTNLAVMDHHVRTLLLVVTGGATAAEAIEQLEADEARAGPGG
jgi:hypothetical protein